MAKEAKEQAPRAAAVASCAATDCRHNESRSCTAGEIELKVEDGAAVCATYSSEKPKARP